MQALRSGVPARERRDRHGDEVSGPMIEEARIETELTIKECHVEEGVVIIDEVEITCLYQAEES